MVLEKVGRTVDSDYINASYVDVSGIWDGKINIKKIELQNKNSFPEPFEAKCLYCNSGSNWRNC